MWRLEDRVEGSVALANRPSQHEHQHQQRNQAAGTTTKAASERGEAQPREVGHAAVQVSPPRGGDPGTPPETSIGSRAGVGGREIRASDPDARRGEDVCVVSGVDRENARLILGFTFSLVQCESNRIESNHCSHERVTTLRARASQAGR